MISYNIDGLAQDCGFGDNDKVKYNVKCSLNEK